MATVREFEVRELEQFLAIRRTALATNPEAFSDSVAKFDARDRSIDEERFRRHVSRDDHMLVGAFDGDLCAAMTGLIRNTQPSYENRATIWGVFVSLDYRGQRLGERMFECIFDAAKHLNWLLEIVLSVKTENAPAIGLYERTGMKIFEPIKSDPVFSSPCAQETHMRWEKKLRL